MLNTNGTLMCECVGSVTQGEPGGFEERLKENHQDE